MWTRLVAGVAAHDINNAAQGLANLLTLAARPGTTRESLERYAGLARDGLADLKRLAATLGTIAVGAEEKGGRPLRLDLACADAVTETPAPDGRSIVTGAIEPGVLVGGATAGARVAISLVLRYALAASPGGGKVIVDVAGGDDAGIVVIEAPDAPPVPAHADTPLGAFVGKPERALGGDGALVLAGAIAEESGAEILVASPGGRGLRFKLRFPRAEKGAEHARSA
jgi:hypothetical protein